MRRGGEWRLLVAVVAATGVGNSGTSPLPVMLGAVTDALGLDERQAGLLGSVEVLAAAVGSMIVTLWAARISRRRLAIVATLLATGCYGLSALVDGYGEMLAARLATGLCCGLVLAAGNAAAAASADPDRFFARVLFAMGLVAGLLFLALPQTLGPWGYAGGFLFLGGICFVSLPLFGWLPNRAALAPSTADSDGDAPAATALTVTGLLGAALFHGMNTQAMWAFSERIGVRVGFSLEEIGLVLAVTTWVGLLGALLASWLGTRLGRSLPLLGGIAVVTITLWGVAQSEAPEMYVATLVTWGLTFFFVMPYMMGTAAALDRAGRWTAAAGASLLFGAALGPYAAGEMITRWGYPGLEWLVLACGSVSLARALPAVLALKSAPSNEVADDSR
jgi:predicted MFS family arabinose efflux permease